jgi:hypothetical protein
MIKKIIIQRRRASKHYQTAEGGCNKKYWRGKISMCDRIIRMIVKERGIKGENKTQ